MNLENITNPIAQEEIYQNLSQDSANSTENNSRLLDQSLVVADTGDIFFFYKKVLGMDFYGKIRLVCFLDNYCKFENVISLAGFKIDEIFCERVNVYALQRIYKGYSFLKVIVLDNIIKLGHLVNEILKAFYVLVETFLAFSLKFIDDIKIYIQNRIDFINERFDHFVYVKDELLNFTTSMFPIMEQTFEQLTKDVSGLTSQEMSKEYQAYYDKTQIFHSLLQQENIILQQSLPLIELSPQQLSQALSNLDSFLNNYDQLTSNLRENFIKYQPIIYNWAQEIVFEHLAINVQKRYFPLFRSNRQTSLPIPLTYEPNQ